MVAGIMQTIDEKVDEDFLFFLEHYNGAFNTLKSQSDKEICSVRTIYIHIEYLNIFKLLILFMCMFTFLEMVR